MTHEDLTAKLRDPRQTMSIDAQTTMLDAADRLDRYRDAMERARHDINWLLSVQEEIPGARIGSQYLDEALK